MVGIRMLCFIFGALAVISSTHADLLPPLSREPKFPPKTQRMLWTDVEVTLARENIAKFPAAKGIAETIVKRADLWMTWDDGALRAIVTTADVPRAFNDATAASLTCT